VTKNVIGLIRFKVICDPPEQDAKGPPRAGNDLYSVDLKVDQHGESCPKDVTVTAYADYRWPAESHMRMQVDGGFPKARVAKTKEVTFAGKTFNRAEAEFHYKLDPGQKTFKLIVDKGKKSHTETVEIKCPPFKVLSAWLKYEVENKSVCPKQVTETATYHTTRPGWVNHEIKMQGGLVVSSGKLTAKREGDQYIATAVRHLTLNAIDKEFMANALDYPANSGWMALKVDCLDVKGDFTFLDKGAPKCPREGRALVNFKTNMPGNIHYSLDCTNGHFSDVAQAVPDNKGGYVAPALVKFNVEKTTQATCALKSVAPIQKVHTFKGHQFQCVIPSGQSATNDVAREPSPATHSTHRPRKKADAASDHAKKARQDAEAERRRHEALKKQRAEEAHKKTEAAYKRREAARQAVELRHKREAAKKAAALRRQREAAKKALQVRHLQTRHRGITAAASQSGVVLR
jgi:hypothetical protein